MLKPKLSLKTFFLFIVMFFIFSGQTSLESQMKELNRLQAQLQALQSGTNPETLRKDNNLDNESIEHNSSISQRYQVVDVNYRQYNSVINGYTELKSVMKIDLYSGDTWLFVIEGQNGFWKRINN
jgi:lipid II:glycine glycyltransferase (peptidoglycan interpeptide bridge formation enzyme)